MRFLKNLGSRNRGTPQEDNVPQMVRKEFAFLVEQYGLNYDGHMEFTSSSVRMQIEVGHKSPRIFIYRVGEPEFTRLLLERVIQYLEGRTEIDDMFIFDPDHPLEHNITFIATLFQRYAQSVIRQMDHWWIPTQAFQYNLIKREYEQAGQLDDFLLGFKR